ncbi:MAG: DNA polymerase III subunit beta [Gammaproteobacteria bacterium HGW-Gammaproteobacteria-1]|jgi:DNA polymerase-3 subunit beta|nr:MAG: DNA polymerase III subunit beta [Gammaproteobacteria bacterium HGW-Gammaproteobacteria-1]
MKFTISREALLKPLQVVGGVVEKRQTLPILANVLIQVDKGKLTLTGTDLEVELTATALVENSVDGEITVPARKFSDICRALPDQATIEVSLDGDKALIRSGKSRFSLSTLPATEYPATEGVTGAFRLTLAQDVFKGLLEQTHFCMANQDVRYYLNGMLLEMKTGQLRTVATDGHRLAISEVDCPDVAGEERQVIIPRKGVLELSRLLGDGETTCELVVSSNHIRVALGDIVMTSKLVDGRFPDYDRVVPKAGERQVTADRNLLRQALQRTSILSNEKYRGIRLQFEHNLLKATVNNPEQEEAEEEVEVEYDGSEFEIGFNVSYVLDALNVVKQDQVVLSMTDANSSCLIHGAGDSASRYVVMPMRL